MFIKSYQSLRHHGSGRFGHATVLALPAMLAASLMVSSPSRADVPDAVLTALRGKPVLLDKKDGSQIRGRLMGHDPKSVVVALGDGRVVTAARADLHQIRVPPARVTARVLRQAAGSAHTQAPDARRARRLERRLRAVRMDRRKNANLLFNLGMGLTISGVLITALGGTLYGVAATQECWEGYCTARGTQMGQAAIAFFVIGPALAVAGIPTWIVGGVRKASLSERSPLWDPHQRRFEAASVGRFLPRAQTVASWRLRF